MRALLLLVGTVLASTLWANSNDWIDYSHYGDLYARSRIALSGASDHLCWLDAEGVKCLSEGDAKPRLLSQFEDPFGLAAGDGVQCVFDRNGVHCWRWGESKIYDYPKVDPSSGLSVSSTHYCYGDRNQGYACPAQPWETAGEALLLPLPYLNWKTADAPPFLVEGGACSYQSGYDGGYQCWTDKFHSRGRIMSRLSGEDHATWGAFFCGNKEMLGRDLRGYERRYAQVVCIDLSKSHECNNNGVNCPDHYFQLNPDIPTEDPRTHGQLDYEDFGWGVRLAATRDGYFCALDNGEHGYSVGRGGYLQKFFEIRCTRLPETDKRLTDVTLAKMTAFKHPILMAPFGDRICALDEFKLTCVKPASGEATTYEGFRDYKEAAQFDSPFGKLEEWTKQVYAEKKPLLDTALALYKQQYGEVVDKGFLYNALLPLVVSLKSEHFDEVDVRYRRLLAELNVRDHVTSLLDYAKDAKAQAAAIQLLQAALPPLVSAESDADKHDKLQKLVAALPSKLPAERTAALQAASPALSSQNSSERLGGLARTAQLLASFLLAGSK